LKWQRWNDVKAAAAAQNYLEEAMRETERVWVMRAGRKAREGGGREGGDGGVVGGEGGGGKSEGGGGDEKYAAGVGREERQEGRKGGRAGWKGGQHPINEKEEEKEEEQEEEEKRTAAVLTFVMDSDERRKGLCLDLFEELMELAQVRWV